MMAAIAPGKARRRAKTAAAVLPIALYALLALSSGLDRLADTRNGDDSGSIRPFVAGRDRAIARGAIDAGAIPEALASARDAVRRDPIDADGLSLLAAAALANGEGADARRVFGVAARLGWREPVTQAYWLHWLIDRRDYRGAGDHLDALLRQAPALPTRNLLLAPFDASPAGRDELARRLADRPAWAANYFADTAALTAGVPLARAEVAILLARRGVRDCPLVAPLVAGLLNHDRYGDARQVRAAHCAGPAVVDGALATDGRFARADIARPPTVLDWHFSDDGAIDANLEADARIPGQAVIVGNAGSVTLAFAEQPLMLPVGDYVVTWRARAGGAPSPAVEATLTCEVGTSPWLPKTLADPDGAVFRIDATVPAGCVRQRLVLGIAGGSRGVAVGDVVLVARRPEKPATRLDNVGPAG